MWRDDYKVHSYEVDLNARATLPALCRFMQESAWNHAEHLGFGYTHLAAQDLIWILSRQVVEMTRYPKWGDTITVQTWPSGLEKLLCYRDFRLFDAEGSVLGLATTTWFAVDVHSRRPQRSSRYFDYQLPVDCEQVLEDRPPKLNSLQFGDVSREIEVGYHDMDVNGHVNNVRYLEWMLESCSLDFLKSHHLSRLEINYLGEATCGETISASLNNTGETGLEHGLSKASDNTELSKARTFWRRRRD